MYNILEGKSEQDRVVHDNKCEKEGFVLLPDLKWDGITKETLYLLAIVRQRGIKSLRDLDESHLPLLRRIRDEGKVRLSSKNNGTSAVYSLRSFKLLNRHQCNVQQ